MLSLITWRPIYVISYICSVWNGVLKIFQWTFLIISQAILKYNLRRPPAIIFWPETPIVLQNIWVSPTAIALIIKRCWILSRRRWNLVMNASIIRWKADSNFGNDIIIGVNESTIICSYIWVSALAISIVVSMLCVECSLHAR